MEYRYRLTEPAIDDIRRYYDQIAGHSPNLAEKWYEKLFARFETLRSFPLSCPIAPESARFGEDVRHLILGKRQSTYRILFVVRGDVVLILAVRRATRGPAEL
jgi:plasmid stabilization system protein ParE